MSDFIEDYLTYTSALEVPDIFHMWVALSTLSAVAQRKIWLEMSHFKIAPNMYIVLNSPAGLCQKDVAMNISRGLLSNFENVIIKSDSITKEKIYETLGNCSQTTQIKPGEYLIHSSLTIFATEMSVLIHSKDKDFISGLVALFNTGPIFRYSTRNRSEFSIVNPYLSILGGTTPDWVSFNITDDMIEGGFSARTLFIHCTQPKAPNPFPELSPEMEYAQLRLLERLGKILNLAGPFNFSKDAKALWSAWYIKHHNEQPKIPKLAHYHYRKKLHAIKIAMLFSLAKKDNLLIEEEDLTRSLQLLALSEPAFEASLRGVGRNILAPIGTKILAQIKSAKECRFNELLRKNISETTGKEFGEILATLARFGDISIEQEYPSGNHIIKYIGKE